jgi:hypothetical protein
MTGVCDATIAQFDAFVSTWRADGTPMYNYLFSTHEPFSSAGHHPPASSRTIRIHHVARAKKPHYKVIIPVDGVSVLAGKFYDPRVANLVANWLRRNSCCTLECGMQFAADHAAHAPPVDLSVPPRKRRRFVRAHPGTL